MDTEHSRQFWSRFSNQCDNRSMLLNADADQLDISDRHDVLDSLPDLTDMDVVEVGCGIGRFTTHLARSARSVLATDFIENFLETNRKQNAHLKNVDFRVCDALSLKLPAQSKDFVFTNWLLMYLSDSEVIQFLQNTLSWLRPGGFIHVRESCTQSSSGSAKNSYHVSNEANPTRYRYSSVYMKLLRNIVYREENGNLYGYELFWGSSIATYINQRDNWRQVHWLARKISLKSGVGIDEKRLLSLFATGWKQEQDRWDAVASNKSAERSNQMLDVILSDYSLPQNSKILIYNGSRLDKQSYIDPQYIARRFNSVIAAVETDEYSYRWLLNRAHHSKDYRVRIFWDEDIWTTINYFKRGIQFDAVILVDMIIPPAMGNLKEIIKAGATILFITSERIHPTILQFMEKELCNGVPMLYRDLSELFPIISNGHDSENQNGIPKYERMLYHGRCQQHNTS